MRLLHERCMGMNDFGVLDQKETFVAFRNREDVENFDNPILSNRLPSHPYIIVRKRGWKLEPKSIAAKIQSRNPEAVVFWDDADKGFYWPEFHEKSKPYLDLCDRYVYCKLNLDGLDDYGKGIKLVPACETPPKRFVKQVIDEQTKILPMSQKGYDVSFMGRMRGNSRKHREKQFRRLIDICGKMGLKVCLKARHFKPPKFAEILNQTKLSFSFKGLGYRCRREWEILLVGSTMILDEKLKNDGVVLCDIVEGEHFIFNEAGRLEEFLSESLADEERMQEIAQRGYELGRECFVDADISLEERYWRVYLLDQSAKIYSYDDLKKYEQKMGLRNAI